MERQNSIVTADIEMAPTIASAPLPANKDEDHYLVAFSPTDPENPLNWPTSRKWAVTDVLSATGFNRIMVSTIMAPALPVISKEFHLNSAESAMALSIYLLATAVGPLFIGPLSEIYGRKRILHYSNLWFLIWNLVCGFATSGGLLIASRFLAGFGASAIYALGGGVLGDLWRPEQRGRSLGIYLLIPLLGAAVGPIIGGYLTARTTWRWMFWSTSAFQAVMIVVSFLTFQETYGPYILQRRAERLRRETGDQRYQTELECRNSSKPNPPSVAQTLGQALTRPLRLLVFHPIIQITALISAYGYGTLYIILSTFSDLWTSHYGESVETSGLHYIAIALGELAGAQVGGPLMDWVYMRLQARSANPDEHKPENRIPVIFLGGVIGPLGLFAYGWTAQYRVHWAAVDVGMFVATFGMQIAGMPLQAYVIDAYGAHTTSALAASQFLRSLTAFLFPLFAPTMYQKLGYGWSNSLLAFSKLFLELPAPLILWFYGARLRAKAVSSY